MNIVKKFFCVSLVMVMLVGCGDDTDDSTKHESAEADIELTQPAEENPVETNEDETANQSTESDASDTDSDSSLGNVGDDPDESVSAVNNADPLSAYSSEQIEYARVWHQLGPNQEIAELNVRHIPAGTPINPEDGRSAVYPEDVIQLAGSRLVDGSVTYSGNGDGTINVYNVPLRWGGNAEAGADDDFIKEYTESIIENTQLVYIEPEAGEEIIELIELIHVQ